MQAVDALSDPIKRRDYDARLKQEEESAAAGRTARSRTGPSAAGSGPRTAAAGGPSPFSEDRAWGLTEMEMACRSCGRSHTCIITEIPS